MHKQIYKYNKWIKIKMLYQQIGNLRWTYAELFSVKSANRQTETNDFDVMQLRNMSYKS